MLSAWRPVPLLHVPQPFDHMVDHPTYTQAEGRHEFFEDRVQSRPGWKPASYRTDPAADGAW